MGQPYVGEIRLVGFNFAPVNWMFCDGSLISIQENTVLFDLIGTTYGGDGVNTFALPDLRGKVPIHQGNNGWSNYVAGQETGAEDVTLTIGQLPEHNHPVVVAATENTRNAANQYPASTSTGAGAYAPYNEAYYVQMAPTSTTGETLPHNNLQPLLTMSYVISLFGVFPSQD
ncbi:MAG TPA: tail fiber protein [Fimbriimonadaceae bacterium]|jgi:microcystin-dependent protein